MHAGPALLPLPEDASGRARSVGDAPSLEREQELGQQRSRRDRRRLVGAQANDALLGRPPRNDGHPGREACDAFRGGRAVVEAQEHLGNGAMATGTRGKRELDGAEYDDWWDHAVATWSTYADYKKKTDRKIPLFLLER